MVFFKLHLTIFTILSLTIVFIHRKSFPTLKIYSYLFHKEYLYIYCFSKYAGNFYLITLPFPDTVRLYQELLFFPHSPFVHHGTGITRFK